jgi:hypothetical protein
MNLWDFLEGDNKGSITIEDLRVVMHILIGVTPQGREKIPENDEKEVDEEGNPKKKPDCFYEDNKLYIRKGRVQKVFVQFKDLYINRIEAHGRAQLAKQALPAPVPEDQSKPEITDKTAKLADKARRKHHGDK